MAENKTVLKLNFMINGEVPESVEIIKRHMPDNKYDGQKIPHLFELSDMFYTSKDSSSNLCIGKFYKKENLDKLLSSCYRFDVMHNGVCGAAVWDKDTLSYKPYIRCQAKEMKYRPLHWIKCGSPIDKIQYYFRPLTIDNDHDKPYFKAFETIKDKLEPYSGTEIITIEYVGDKINKSASDNVDCDTTAIIHGSIGLNIPESLRNYYGFQNIFKHIPTIKGIIVYTESGVYKLISSNFFGSLYNNCTDNYLRKYNINGSISSFALA